MRWLHILAGLIGLASAAVALFALKGGPLHRKSGAIFVYAMLVLSSSGALMAVLRGQRFNVIAGVLTFYLVLTALLTVRRRDARAPWIDLAAMLVALVGGLVSLRFGFEAAASAVGNIDGLPAAPAFFFGVMALLAVLGDARLLLGRRLQPRQRLARHVWRMGFPTFVAAGSFFLGQAQVFPRSLRRSGLLAVPVLVVIVLTFYWLARVRSPQWHNRVLPTVSRHGAVALPCGEPI